MPSTNIYTFHASRFFSGAAGGIALAARPMYIGEVSIPEVRGTWRNLFSSAIYFGPFTVTVLGSYFHVNETAYICIPFPILFCILFAFRPESPYYPRSKEKLMIPEVL
ncbi:hypothetical protein JTB14_015097 [Gonioctena quinquepunctata]|nr:hypothetical protein JTB14_015097 [Gonioctena quinquepunctata]